MLGIFRLVTDLNDPIVIRKYIFSVIESGKNVLDSQLLK
jgi:hypothetical protein